jgi:2-dehydro-3-deoxygluconokinase
MSDGLRIACMGEPLIELSRFDAAAGQAHVAFAGDTLNTAIYLSRLMPGAVSYLTNLGTDAFSGQMIARMEEEGIDVGLIGRHPTRLPGIYAISLDARGERSFRYWRDMSAPRTLFSAVGPTLDDLARFDVIYLSGITLAILPADVRAALIARLAVLRGKGRQIVFDNNFRPALWPDAATARAAFAAMWAAASMALPSADDERVLYPGAGTAEILDRIGAAGAAEIVLKAGADGPVIRQGGGDDLHPALPAPDRIVDPTGAGDSFNAGYLAARLSGAAPGPAAESAHRLAVRVIGHHGAIIPKAAMP